MGKQVRTGTNTGVKLREITDEVEKADSLWSSTENKVEIGEQKKNLYHEHESNTISG